MQLRLLVPTDFSEAATAAAHLATRMADSKEHEIILLHVDTFSGTAPTAIEPTMLPVDVWARMADEHGRATKKKLHELETSLERVGGPIIRTRSVHGSAIDQICAVAKEIDAHLIVMGSHGASGSERVFFGSTAEAVVREAATPVLVTRAENPIKERFSSAVVGVDFSEFSNTLARLAAALLAPTGELRLVHVIHRPFLGALDAAISHVSDELQRAEEDSREAAARSMDQFVEALDVRDLVIKAFVEVGSVEDQLLTAASDSDLIAVGAHCRKRLGDRILGTTADRVVRHASIPVLVLPEDAMYPQ